MENCKINCVQIISIIAYSLFLYTRENDKLITVQYSFSLTFVPLLAAFSVERCPDKEDSTQWTFFFFHKYVWANMHMNMHIHYN